MLAHAAVAQMWAGAAGLVVTLRPPVNVRLAYSDGGGDRPEGGAVRVLWDTGDATAHTEIGLGTIENPPAVAEWTVAPGVTHYDTGVHGVIRSSGSPVGARFFWVRHRAGLKVSRWEFSEQWI